MDKFLPEQDAAFLSNQDKVAQALFEYSQNEGPAFWPILQTIFDGIPQGLLVAGRDGKIVVFNLMAQKIMGYSAQEIVGQVALWDFCQNYDKPPIFQQNLQQGRSFSEEEVEMSVKNSQVTVGVRITALSTTTGVLQGAVAIIRDLAAWRAKQWEQKNLLRLASIGRIISAVAHEINNPLQAVRTSLELGLDPRKSAARRGEYLLTANQEIERIGRVINQMRNFYPPNPDIQTATNINEVVNEALYLLQKHFQKNQVQVEVLFQPVLPKVSVISYQLKQVFLNLLFNALETMPTGGKLQVETRLAANNMLTIIFTDNAEPAETTHVEQLFDPFAHNRSGGLGLSLSVSREIISEMGGHIELQLCEKPAIGHILTVYLPY